MHINLISWIIIVVTFVVTFRRFLVLLVGENEKFFLLVIWNDLLAV
jgi:hypothetical protein